MIAHIQNCKINNVKPKLIRFNFVSTNSSLNYSSTHPVHALESINMKDGTVASPARNVERSAPALRT